MGSAFVDMESDEIVLEFVFFFMTNFSVYKGFIYPFTYHAPSLMPFSLCGLNMIFRGRFWNTIISISYDLFFFFYFWVFAVHHHRLLFISYCIQKGW